MSQMNESTIIRSVVPLYGPRSFNTVIVFKSNFFFPACAPSNPHPPPTSAPHTKADMNPREPPFPSPLAIPKPLGDHTRPLRPLPLLLFTSHPPPLLLNTVRPHPGNNPGVPKEGAKVCDGGTRHASILKPRGASCMCRWLCLCIFLQSLAYTHQQARTHKHAKIFQKNAVFWCRFHSLCENLFA